MCIQPGGALDGPKLGAVCVGGTDDNKFPYDVTSFASFGTCADAGFLCPSVAITLVLPNLDEEKQEE